ncbi:MAG: JAB domain-containing protein [Deltaproteobacteria bacterium]|nr:JAB domain-containing protein [Deltaproteobacteria bacterium]
METVYELESFKVRLGVHEPPGQKVSCAETAAAILRPIYADLDADQEHFTVLFLNNKNMIRGYKVLFTGGQTTSAVSPAIVFRAAILMGACAIVLAHNHPSGDTAPSPEDLELTRRLAQCGELFGIRALDHIILGANQYFSFADRGMMDDGGIATETARRKAKNPRRKRASHL